MFLTDFVRFLLKPRHTQCQCWVIICICMYLWENYVNMFCQFYPLSNAPDRCITITALSGDCLSFQGIHLLLPSWLQSTETQRRQQCLLWPKPPAFVFVYSGSKMIYGFSLRCRCAVEPRWNVWWKITHAGVALSPLKMQNSGGVKKKKKRQENQAGAFAKKTSFSYILSKQPLHNSRVQAERRECMCVHQNKVSGASRWYVILRKPGGTFDLLRFQGDKSKSPFTSVRGTDMLQCSQTRHSREVKALWNLVHIS